MKYVIKNKKLLTFAIETKFGSKVPYIKEEVKLYKIKL